MKGIILSVMIIFIISGCSKVLLPYEEEPACKKGIGKGVCGSLSEVYKYSSEEKKWEDYY